MNYLLRQSNFGVGLFQIQHCVNNPYFRILDHSSITQKTKMAYLAIVSAHLALQHSDYLHDSVILGLKAITQLPPTDISWNVYFLGPPRKH